MAKVSFDYAALVSNFSGKVQVIESGVRAIENERDIYVAMREGGKVAADSVREGHAMEMREERKMDAFRESRYIGNSVSEALDAYNSQE